MTEEEKEIILALAMKKIAADDFLTTFRNGSLDGLSLCKALLLESLEAKAADDVECALIVGFVFGFAADHLDALLQLALEPWHSRHEDVISALGKIKSSLSVETLYAATQWAPDYLDLDTRSLAVKAIWVLGGIPGEASEAALEKLSSDPVFILRETALKQLAQRRVS